MGIRLTSGGRGSLGVELGDAALAAKYAREAKEAAEVSRAAALYPPKIGENGNWQIWDGESGAYADSGVRAVGPAGAQGPQGEAGNYTKPAAGIPEEDLSQSVQNKLNSGGVSDYAELNNKPAINGVTLSGNKTAAQLGLAADGDVPTKTSQLQNDAGFLTQHQSLAAYRTAADQNSIDAGKEAAGLGLTGAAVGDLVRVAAVDANGKPTGWEHVRSRKLLWSNPNTGYFGAENITLSSSDYDRLEVVFKPTNTAEGPRISQFFAKGYNLHIFVAYAASNEPYNTFIMVRKITRNSDTSFTSGLGVIARWGSSSGGETGHDNFCYPIAIYGLK